MNDDNLCNREVLSKEQVGHINDLIDEKALILEMVESRRAWNAMGKLAGSLKTCLGWLIGMGAMYVTFKASTIQWVQEALTK